VNINDTLKSKACYVKPNLRLFYQDLSWLKDVMSN